MAITVLSSSHPGVAAETYNVTVPCDILDGVSRILFVSAQSQGNNGQANITRVELQQLGGTLIKALVPVLTVAADNILHCHYYALLDADMPAAGSYQVYVEAYQSNPGAFVTMASYILFTECSQTYTPLTAYNTNAGGIDISQHITIPAPGAILDNWAGEGGSANVKTLTGNNTVYFESLQAGTLKGVAGFYAAPAAGTYTFTWSGDFHNRNAMGIFFWAGSTTPPTSDRSINPLLIGANW